jgi:hypothetical protein
MVAAPAVTPRAIMVAPMTALLVIKLPRECRKSTQPGVIKSDSAVTN